MTAQRYRRRVWIFASDTGPLHRVPGVADAAGPPPAEVGRDREPYQTGGTRRPHAGLPVAVERAVMPTNRHRDQ